MAHTRKSRPLPKSSLSRCSWVKEGNTLYVAYHDSEWGVPVVDDQKLFEFIVLESAQAGLSWQTILNKREGYRKAFKNFDPHKVSKMTEKDVARLATLPDSSIVRNRLKIKATIANAKAFVAVQKEFGSFASYMWSFVDGKPIQNNHTHMVPATTALAERMAKDLKKRGFSFLGPTVWYAHMQAVGMVNDHVVQCFRHLPIRKMRVKIPERR